MFGGHFRQTEALIEHTSASEGRRDFLLVFNDSRKIGLRVAALLNRLDELVETLEAGNLIGISELCRIENRRQNGKRFVVGLERNWKRLTVLAAERK